MGKKAPPQGRGYLKLENNKKRISGFVKCPKGLLSTCVLAQLF